MDDQRRFFATITVVIGFVIIIILIIGIVSGKIMLDLEYSEDSKASVDMNVIATPQGHLIEVQATGEESTFTHKELDELLNLAKEGILKIVSIQKSCFSS